MGSEQVIVPGEGPVLHPLTVDEFLILDEAGAFDNVGRVELVDGEIFVMSPIHLPHSRTLMRLSIEVGLALDRLPGLEALSPVSAHLDPHSLPEADIMVAGTSDDEGFATTETIRLAIEVADSSLRYDLGKKARLYARTGVPEYWVADVRGRRVIRMYVAVDGVYAERREFTFGEPVRSATIERLVIDTSRLA